MERDRDRDQQEAGHVAEDLHQPDERAGEPDLALRDEVGHVALEGPAGDVRREREERDERPQCEDVVRGRDPEQADQVEQRADDDKRLAAAPARDGVVADRADRGLDEDPDDRDRDREQEGRPADLELADEVVELQAVLDEQADGAVDCGEAEPVERDPDEVADGQRGGRAAAGRDGIAGQAGSVAQRFTPSPGIVALGRSVRRRPGRIVSPARASLRR
jgi:hypothetical protein